jgi:hypothetical protein
MDLTHFSQSNKVILLWFQKKILLFSLKLYRIMIRFLHNPIKLDDPTPATDDMVCF